MRKLCLTVAAAATILSAGAFTADSNAMTLGAGSGLRPAIKHTSVVGKVRMVCGHFWNGRYYRQARCVWVRGGHRHHHFR